MYVKVPPSHSLKLLITYFLSNVRNHHTPSATGPMTPAPPLPIGRSGYEANTPVVSLSYLPVSQTEGGGEVEKLKGRGTIIETLVGLALWWNRDIPSNVCAAQVFTYMYTLPPSLSVPHSPSHIPYHSPSP